jgi:hypothetical protein
LEKLCEALRGLGLDHPIENPYRLMTKGEMLERSQDPGLLQRLAPRSLSCAHPEAARYVRRRQGNCGYCFPCLIRRAALHRTGMDSAGDYAFDALREDGEMQGDRGADLRALLRSLHRPHAPVDVLRNGPLQPDEVVAFADVNRRGREELLSWLHEANPSPHVRGQLPANL